MILGTFPPRSAEWHEARRWRVGGSDVAVILGHSPYGQTSAQLMRAKLDGDTIAETPAMQRGRLLEPAVLAWAAERHGLEYDASASAATYVHDEHNWALGNPDALTTTGVLVEAKTTGNRCDEDGWGRAGTDRVPLVYAYQVQWLCGVTGATEWLLPVHYGGHNGRPANDFAAYKGKADPAIFARLITYCGRWHARLIETRDRNAA